MPNIRNSTLERGRVPMKSRAMPLVETAVNVVVGYGLAVLVQLLIFPVLGLRVSLGEGMIIGLVFTTVSMAQGSILSRLFERIMVGGLQQEAAVLRRTAASVGLWVGQLPMR